MKVQGQSFLSSHAILNSSLPQTSSDMIKKESKPQCVCIKSENSMSPSTKLDLPTINIYFDSKRWFQENFSFKYRNLQALKSIPFHTPFCEWTKTPRSPSRANKKHRLSLTKFKSMGFFPIFETVKPVNPVWNHHQHRDSSDSWRLPVTWFPWGSLHFDEPNWSYPAVS